MAGVKTKTLRHWYEIEKLSIPQIAQRSGMTRSTVRKRLIDDGVTLRKRADGVRLRASDIGAMRVGKKRKPFSEAHKAAISRARTEYGEKHAKGTSTTHGGHLRFTRGQNKDRAVHIAIMEKRLGRRLRRDEIVHHIDGLKESNDEDNLALMTRAGHTRFHRYLEKLKREAARGRS